MTRRLRGIGGLSIAGGVAALLALAAAPGAGARGDFVAEAGGYSYVSDTTSPAMGRIKDKVACPGKQHVLSTGASTNGGYDESSAVAMYPADGGDADTVPDDLVKTRADNPVLSGKVLQSGAICAKGRHKYKQANLRLDPAEEDSAQLNCPGDYQVTGGGVKTTGPVGSARITSSQPADSADAGSEPDDGWRAVVLNLSNSEDQKSTVYAICGRDEYSYVSDSSNVLANTRSAAQADCADDEFAIGGGGLTLDDMALSSSLSINDPTPPNNSIADDGWRVVADNYDSSTHSLTAYAICGLSLE